MAALAQSPAQDARKLDAVTVIAKPQDPQSTMGSAYVLTQRELEKFEDTNINSVLRRIPGVYVREEDGMGTFPNIGIRAGSSGRSGRISLMEDGIPAAMSPYANTSAYYFPTLGRMSGVEVLKGPEVLLYGPQTTSGAINLLSTPIPDAAGGALKTELGQFGTRKIHANYGATVGQWGFLAETYQRETDGFHKIDRSTRTAGSDVEEYLLKARWRSAPDAALRQQVDLKLFSGQEDADVSYLGLTDADFRANPDRRYHLGELQRMDRSRKSASVRHQIELHPSTLFTTTAYWSDTSRHYDRLNQVNGVGIGSVVNTINNNRADAPLLQGILNGTANTTHGNGVRYGHNHQDFVAKGLQLDVLSSFATASVQHEITAGVRWHHDATKNGTSGIGNSIYRQVDGSLVYESTSAAALARGEAEAMAFWAADRISMGALTLMPVIRHERIRSHADTSVAKTDLNSNQINKTTLGLGANYALTQQWTLLAGVHQGFAPPGSGVANGTKGEESTNYEAGVRYRQGEFGVDAIGFYSDYTNAMRNCLVANPCPNGAVDGTQQTGSKKVYGLELGMSANLYNQGGHRIPARLAYTFTNGEYTKDSDVATGVRKGDVLEYAPKHMASAQLGWETAAWKSYASFNYAASACSTNTCGRAGVDGRYLETDALFTVDLSTSYQLTRDVQIYAKLDNVFDKQKITSRGPDGARGNMGRYFAAGMRVSF
ncbi:TonB-dependent receptor [Pantoea sp. 18069]|uniref:TonB-dependent receptor family protein n=1 Tax=Pantoea sp. 18069 TaxID=2681415 RepID=UPI001356DC73|nr:TonB-dependent receptor [Pantoea sp. 18069]